MFVNSECGLTLGRAALADSNTVRSVKIDGNKQKKGLLGIFARSFGLYGHMKRKSTTFVKGIERKEAKDRNGAKIVSITEL